jgi:hypothetical protein
MRPRTLSLGFLAAILTGIPSSAQQSGNFRLLPRTGTSAAARVQSNYGNLPVTFEANHGQTDPQVRFVSRGPGYRSFLMSDGIVLSLRAKEVVATQATNAVAAGPSQRSTLVFRLLGTAPNPTVIGEVQQLGRVNYFVGNDSAKWQRNVPTYAQVRYKNIYPGIDLLYYGNHRQLEYDFAVAAGADPGQIQFEISGASQIHVDTDGTLVLTIGSGEVYFQPPIVYQESNGQRVAVNGGYVVDDPTHVSFQVAQYDPSKPLVIDPVLVYSTYLGGSGDDQPGGIAVDTTGNVYVAGSTDSTDFPLTTPGSLPAGNTHVFVAKLDATGSNLIYADYLGGSNEDYGYAVALDAANNVYVTGSTASSDFPMVNPFQGTYPGSFNAFLTKISPDGSSLLYSSYFGGNGSDVPSNVAVDGTGDMVIAGYTSSTNLPVANAYQATMSANLGGMYGNYGFLTKFNPSGSSLTYSTYFGGSSNVPFNCGGSPCWPQPASSIAAMQLDAAGNAYVTGTTNTYDFPITPGVYLATDSIQMNGSVGFVSKFSGAGSLQYSTYFYEASGLLTDITGIAVDGSGSAYITGVALSDGTFPITSTSICDPSVYGWACNYAFVTKFDAAGATLLYSTFLGPNNNANPQAIALDSANDAYVLAFTGSGSFSTVNGIENYSSGNDVLLVEIDAAASTELFATYLGGSEDEQPAPAGIVVDGSGDIYVTGTTDSTDFPVTQSVFQSVFGGSTDAFIVKIGAESAPAVSLSPASLQYASQAVGSSSPQQSVLLRNMGSSSLSISSITTAGDFSETDNCGSGVPAAGTCTLSVAFSPTAPGDRTGTIAIQDDAGSPHIISLDGRGLGPAVTLTPSSLSFPSVAVGSSSTAQAVTLANSGNATLSISGIQIAGDYGQTNNCPASLSDRSSCAVNVTFAPTASGARSGTVTINDGAPDSPQVVGLSGAGSDFSVSASVNSDTVKAGATATYTLNVSSVGGTFANAIKLSCSGAPANTTCGLSPSSVTPGSNPASVTLTVQTTAASAELIPLSPAQSWPVYAVWMMQLQGLGLFGIMLAGSKRRTRKLAKLIALVLLVAAMLSMSGCAGGTGIASQSQQGTTPGTYTITVSGTSGALQHSVPVTLTVQ